MYSFDNWILCGSIDVLCVCAFDTQQVLVEFRKKKTYNKEKPSKAHKTQAMFKDKVWWFLHKYKP